MWELRQTLGLEDCEEVIETLTVFAKNTRVKEGISEKQMIKEKFIKFDSKVQHKKPPLTTS